MPQCNYGNTSNKSVYASLTQSCTVEHNTLAGNPYSLCVGLRDMFALVKLSHKRWTNRDQTVRQYFKDRGYKESFNKGAKQSLQQHQFRIVLKWWRPG